MHTFERAVEHLGESKGMQDHDHDVVHELSRSLDSLWRYDQYIANAGANLELRAFWLKMKEQEADKVAQLKHLIAEHIQHNCL